MIIINLKTNKPYTMKYIPEKIDKRALQKHCVRTILNCLYRSYSLLTDYHVNKKIGVIHLVN